MLRRPSREGIYTYFSQFALLIILFSVVYGTTNSLAQNATHPYQLWIPEELNIPFVPEFIFIYFSINLLTFVPLFVLEVHQLKALSKTYGGAILGAGCVFFFVPAPIGWQRPDVVDGYDFFYKLLYSLDQSANTFPSLHITFGYISARVLVAVEPRLLPIWTWFLLISLSVLLTHQHHLIDIFGGIVLGEICYRWIFNTFSNSQESVRQE